MFAFLRNGLRRPRKSGSARRAAHEELLKLEAEYQVRINDLNRKVEKQQERQQEILTKGKRELSELAKLGLAEQYARGERHIRRLLDRRKMLVKAQELVEVQLANIDLQDVIPEEILSLNRPEAQRERVLAEMVRDRLDQAYEDMLASFESATSESKSDMHEHVAVQAVLELFDRERDEEFRLTIQAIEKDLDTAAATRFKQSDPHAREIE